MSLPPGNPGRAHPYYLPRCSRCGGKCYMGRIQRGNIGENFLLLGLPLNLYFILTEGSCWLRSWGRPGIIWLNNLQLKLFWACPRFLPSVAVWVFLHGVFIPLRPLNGSASKRSFFTALMVYVIVPPSSPGLLVLKTLYQMRIEKHHVESFNKQTNRQTGRRWKENDYNMSLWRSSSLKHCHLETSCRRQITLRDKVLWFFLLYSLLAPMLFSPPLLLSPRTLFYLCLDML